VVHPLLPVAVMSAANWSETWQKLHQHGADAGRVTSRLRTLGVRVEPLSKADAVTADTAWAALDIPIAVRTIR
jgi:PIN domain nuclease of toxin-antitoxin system